MNQDVETVGYLTPEELEVWTEVSALRDAAELAPHDATLRDIAEAFEIYIKTHRKILADHYLSPEAGLHYLLDPLTGAIMACHSCM